MLRFLKEKVLTLGTAACPPYHLAIVIGGTSAELCMKNRKAGLRALSRRAADPRPRRTGNAFRDLEMEQKILKMTQSLGVGAQFGGKYFCHDVRVNPLAAPRRVVADRLGVSCSADRQVLGKITKDGVYLEELEHKPRAISPAVEQALGGEVVKIDLNQPMKDILGTLSKHPIKTRLSLTGNHDRRARFGRTPNCANGWRRANRLPDYFKNHPVLLRGSGQGRLTVTPPARFGPTTAGGWIRSSTSFRPRADRW